MNQPQAERPLGELFSDLSSQVSRLVRDEVRLARAELSEKASNAGRGAVFMGAGAALAYAGLLALLAALIIGLGQLGVPWWLSALIVGAVVLGAGYLLLQRGMAAMKPAQLTPSRTIRSLSEDGQWAKHQVTS